METWIKDGIVINTEYLCFLVALVFPEAIKKVHVYESAAPAWGGGDESSSGALKIGYRLVIATLNTE